MKNDYLNTRYKEIKDSLSIISDNIDNAFERIKEYAQTMTLENLDDHDENYIKAYECFSKGELDSVSYYLSDYNLDVKYQKIIQLQAEAKKERELAEILTESARQKDEYTENSLNELIKEWLLLARTYAIKNDYDKTMAYYEKVVEADTFNAEVIFEYAKYLTQIRNYEEAEPYYNYCFDITQKLCDKNAEVYVPFLAEILNCMGVNYDALGNYDTAEMCYLDCVEIRELIVTEFTEEKYKADLSMVLNNLGLLYYEQAYYSESTAYLMRSLAICEELETENPKKYRSLLATVLSNIGANCRQLGNLSEAEEYFLRSLAVREELFEEQPEAKMSRQDLAGILTNIANNYRDINNNAEAEKYYFRGLKMMEELARENPKAYLFALAVILNNIGINYYNRQNYAEAEKYFFQCMDIREILIQENPQIYSSGMQQILNNIGQNYRLQKKYTEASEYYLQSLQFYEMLEENKYDINLMTEIMAVCYNLSTCYIFIEEYKQAEYYARRVLERDNFIPAKVRLANALLLQNRFSEAEEIYKELAQIKKDSKTYAQIALDEIEELKKHNSIPQKCKADIEKIKEMFE